MPIKYNYEVSVNDNKAKLNKDIFLFRGNRNIHYYFSIKGARFTFSKENEDLLESSNAIYAAVTVVKPNGVEVANAIAPVEDGLIHLKVTEDLIDEEVEVGDFDLVFDLFDDNEGAVTIPKIKGQFHVQERPCTTSIGTLSGNVNVVNQAVVDLAIATQENEQLIVVDDDGKYVKTTWVKGDKISIERLNKIEEGIEKNSTQYKDIAKLIESGNIGNNIEPAYDDIPNVFFYGDTSTMSKSQTVDLNFEYKSKTATYKGVATTKWQGSSSLSYPKKNYTIKLFTDNTKSTKLKLNMKNWGKQNKFCLKANYVDSLHNRNITGARIAYDMIKSRSDFSSLPTELQEAPRCGVIDGFPIKVYMNGELMGLYTWNIPKDKWCSNMNEDNPNHAFLMAEKNNNGSATDNLTLACEFRANATIFADTSTAQYPAYDWVVEGPGDDVSAEIRTSFNSLINCVKNTDDATFKATIGNYLDLTSAFDYYSFAYLACHYDGLGKNLGMATYDGIKWFCILYDMDSIFGAKIDGSGFLETNRKCPEQYQETNSLLWERIEKCFGAELYARYKELRQGALSLGNIFTHAEEIYDIIPDRLYTEDRAKWTSLPSVNTNTIKRMRDYMIARASYVDGEMQTIGTPKVACTGITLDKLTLSFTTADAQTLTATVTPTNTTDNIAWSISPAGICNIENGVVTPVKDGSCVITVTCGSQTATCNVTVTGVQADKPCTGISLNNSTLTFTSAETKTLIATVMPTDTTDIITWTSNNNDVATVENGVVTPVSNGECIITASCGTRTATCNISISGLSLLSESYNGYLNTTTGEVTESASDLSSGFIKVTPGENYLFGYETGSATGSLKALYYNNDKVYLNKNDSVYTGNLVFTVPEKCAYIRVCALTEVYKNAILKKLKNAGDYSESIVQLTETTNYIPLKKSYKLNDNTGVEESNTDCLISYYIEVTKNQNLTCTVNGGNYLRVYGYDDGFDLVNKITTGQLANSSVTISIPSGVKYIRIQSFKGISPVIIIVN